MIRQFENHSIDEKKICYKIVELLTNKTFYRKNLFVIVFITELQRCEKENFFVPRETGTLSLEQNRIKGLAKKADGGTHQGNFHRGSSKDSVKEIFALGIVCILG